MNQATEPVPAQNPDACARGRRMRTPGRRALLQRPLRAVQLVVVGVLAQDQSQGRTDRREMNCGPVSCMASRNTKIGFERLFHER
jgi:hypothetical protein